LQAALLHIHKNYECCCPEIKKKLKKVFKKNYSIYITIIIDCGIELAINGCTSSKTIDGPATGSGSDDGPATATRSIYIDGPATGSGADDGPATATGSGSDDVSSTTITGSDVPEIKYMNYYKTIN
jgi:hypothetical protein